jgi:hypothetical protein
MPLTLAQVETLAPDQASLDAAGKLIRPGKWASVACDPEGKLAWGECQGSGSAPYRTVATIEDLGYRCSCPSRKFPCKHSLALLWRYAEHPEQFSVGAPPDWVVEWLAKRRGKTRSDRPESTEPAEKRERSIAAAVASKEKPADEAKAARAVGQRERTHAARETAVLGALDELDQWIGDQLHRGLAHFPAVAREQCRTAARRLADGKAAGLANRVDALPVDLFKAPERERGDLLLEWMGGLHLVAAAYRRQDALPPGLRDDVRRLVGWTVKREELLGDSEALRVTSRWTTLAVRTEVEPDGLRRVETWLARPGLDAPRAALLLDYFPAGSSISPSLRPGDAFEAEAVFYPSAAPLRAVLDGRGPILDDGAFPDGVALHLALERYDEILAMQPFVDQWPLVASPVEVLETEGGTFILVGHERAVPLDPGQTDDLIPLLGMSQLTVCGLWNGRRMHLLAATTPLGTWYGS